MNDFSGLLRAHFDQPRNAGRLEGATGHGIGRNAACGDEVHLWVREDAGRLAEVRFQARSCSAAIAVASLAAEALEGREVAEARDLDLAGLVSDAGGLSAGRTHAIAVVSRALREALDGKRAVPGPA